MYIQIKVFIVFVSFLTSFSCIFYFLDLILKRAALRQFYRDLVHLALLYEQSDVHVCLIQMPKILGSRIVRFPVYEAVLKALLNVYYSGTTDYHSFLAYVLSLHKSYCYSNRDLIKFKNKLLKEKTQK